MVIEVLVVEDDPMVAEINSGYVQAVRGFRVTARARRGADALRLAQEHRPHLVLLDIYLPDGDGVNVLRALRQQEVPADAIVVSAAQDAATIQSVLRLGAVDYIIKPFRFERLRDALIAYRDLRGQLLQAGALSQEQVDSVLHVRRSGPAGPPKGLNAATLARVQEFLQRAEAPVTAVAAAAGLGMARVTVRRYLDYLVRQGHARVDIQYGTVGRPQNRYAAR